MVSTDEMGTLNALYRLYIARLLDGIDTALSAPRG